MANSLVDGFQPRTTAEQRFGVEGENQLSLALELVRRSQMERNMRIGVVRRDEWDVCLVMKDLEPQLEAKIPELFELFEDDVKGPLWIDAYGDLVKHAGIAVQLLRQLSNLLQDLDLASKLGREEERVSIARRRHSNLHDRGQAEDIERDGR